MAVNSSNQKVKSSFNLWPQLFRARTTVSGGFLPAKSHIRLDLRVHKAKNTMYGARVATKVAFGLNRGAYPKFGVVEVAFDNHR